MTKCLIGLNEPGAMSRTSPKVFREEMVIVEFLVFLLSRMPEIRGKKCEKVKFRPLFSLDVRPSRPQPLMDLKIHVKKSL